MGLYMNYQRPYVVLYMRDDIMKPFDPPFPFTCMAEDDDHAEEQCLNAEPAGDVVWVVQTDDVQAAYDDYWGVKLCRYCGGNCPTNKEDVCEGYSGDIDNLYSEEN